MDDLPSKVAVEVEEIRRLVLDRQPFSDSTCCVTVI
jgi:hypothetical protein